MNRFLFLVVTAALFISLMPMAAVGQDFGVESEGEKTRPNRDEIAKLMIQVALLPVAEQNSKMDRIWKDPSGSQTPRSDFLFCTGLAHLGNFKAQACLGNAFENGIGVVNDSYEAYIWYALALDNVIGGEELKQKVQESKDRVKRSLMAVYPAPSDQELEEVVAGQKDRIAELQAETGKTQR